MGQRKRVGIVFQRNENWIGGTYYYLNLISALNCLEDHLKPEITILTTDGGDLSYVKNITKYPYLSDKVYYERNLIKRMINKLSRTITGKNVFEKRPTGKEIDVVFPSNNNYYFKMVPRKIHWIPDFQEIHLPEFFSEQEINTRHADRKALAGQHDTIIFSSRSALKDFEKTYPGSAASTQVLNFAVTHPDFRHQDIKALMDKYRITGNFFICANQFWAHKNHQVILEALSILKQKGIGISMVFTGKVHDYRSNDYFPLLKKYIQEKQLDDYVNFIGFVEREEQLKLLEASIAVIQPSLFEGWSTVVEDAKALNQLVVASDLEVHREQLDRNAVFFDPHDYQGLAAILEKLVVDPPPKEALDYKQQVDQFANRFLEILESNQT